MSEPGLKKCIKCGEDKVIADFYSAPRNKDGKEHVCKECARRESLDSYYRRVTLPACLKDKPEAVALLAKLKVKIVSGEVKLPDECELCGKEGKKLYPLWNEGPPEDEDTYSAGNVCFYCAKCHKLVSDAS